MFQMVSVPDVLQLRHPWPTATLTGRRWKEQDTTYDHTHCTLTGPRAWLAMLHRQKDKCSASFVTPISVVLRPFSDETTESA